MSTLVIITRGRTASCIKCIETMLEFPSATEIIVIDGSLDSYAESEFKSLLKPLNIRKVPIYYLGNRQRSRLLDSMASGDDHKDVTGFGFRESELTFSAGAARNLALKLLNGAPFAMIDDDVRGRVARRPESEPKVTICYGMPCDLVEHFATRSQAIDEASWSRSDLVSDLTLHLGRGLAEFAGEQGTHLCNCVARRSDDIEAGKVAVVQCGVIGDSGSFSADWMPFDQCRLSAAGLRTILRSREVIKSPLELRASRSPACMSIALGLDGRTALPPFMPRFRNEDGVFGNLLMLTTENCWSLHLPEAVLHSPTLARSYESCVRLRLCEIVLAALQSIGSKLTSNRQAIPLEALGTGLMELADDKLHFKDVLAYWADTVYKAKVRKASDMASQHRCAVVRRHGTGLIRRLDRGARMEKWLVPLEMHDVDTCSEGVRQTCSFLSSLGQLLHQWPRLSIGNWNCVRDELMAL